MRVAGPPVLTGSVLSIHADEHDPRPPFTVASGVREREAVMLLRRFYATENENAPEPQKRTRKQIALGAAAEEEARCGATAGPGDEEREGEAPRA